MNAFLPAASRRERRFYDLGAAIALLGVGLLVGLLWALFPRGRYQPVASIDRFPPSEEPYFVTFSEARLAIVNTGDEFYVFDAHSTRPGCLALVRWNPDAPHEHGYRQTGRFDDTCHGAQYTLTGENVIGSGPPARGLDAYQYEIRGGELWVCLACQIRGDPPSDGG